MDTGTTNTTVLTPIERAKLDAKKPLDELQAEGGKQVRITFPPTLRNYVVGYQKAYHRLHKKRITRDDLMNLIIQRSLVHLARETERMSNQF